jgi:hypothetical protein
VVVVGGGGRCARSQGKCNALVEVDVEVEGAATDRSKCRVGVLVQALYDKEKPIAAQ